MRTTLLLAPLALTAVVAAGCGDDSDDDTAATESTTAPTTTAVTAGAEPVDVVAVNYGFEGLPDEVDAGTAFTLQNDASDEVHELVAFRLPDGEQRSAEELLALPEEQIGALLAGPPSLGLVALPGEDGDVLVGDGTLSEPGRYLVFCAIPTGAAAADVQAAMAEALETGGPPEIPGGPPHFTSGMYGDIEVR